MDAIHPPKHPRETLVCIGQETTKSAFEKALQLGRLHHSWLLHGPQGVGKQTLAYQIARMMLLGLDTFQALENIPPTHPVLQQLAAGSHPHFLSLEPEVAGKSLAVEKVHQLTPFLQHTTPPKTWRVVLIDGVDTLSKPAANALLKAIEEPRDRVLFLLLSQNVHDVLPTLRSRCRVLKLTPLPQDQIQQHVRNLVPSCTGSALETLLTCSQGCWGRARGLLQEGQLEKVTAFFQLLDQTLSPSRDASVQPVILPKNLVFLESEDLAFWKPFFFIWLETQALEALNHPDRQLDVGWFVRAFKDQAQFHLDIRHVWARLLGRLSIPSSA